MFVPTTAPAVRRPAKHHYAAFAVKEIPLLRFLKNFLDTKTTASDSGAEPNSARLNLEQLGERILMAGSVYETFDADRSHMNIYVQGTNQNDELVVWYNDANGRIEAAVNDGTGWTSRSWHVSELQPHQVKFFLNGFGGNDKINQFTWYGTEATGGYGNDTIRGGSGDDVLNGEWDNDSIEGGDGFNTIRGGYSYDNDTLIGGSGTDYIYGGPGTDRLEGRGGNDALHGEGDTDHLFGGEGTDVLAGGDGSDYLYGEGGQDFLYGDGYNSWEYGHDHLDGGHDYITDYLYGGGGGDTFVQHMSWRPVYYGGYPYLRQVDEDSITDFGTTHTHSSHYSKPFNWYFIDSVIYA
jgi:Ca2+-binding RTX toxin-like protein